MSQIDKSTRDAVLARDGYRCQICHVDRDRHALTVDHIKPRSHGGTDLISNLRTAHKSCNTARGNRAVRTASGGYVR